MSMRRFVSTAKVIGACLMALAGTAATAAYPDRPITIIVPTPAGGASDVVARTLANKLKEVLKTQIIVDNRAGATGSIGAHAVARAPADGYTILYHFASLVINPWLSKDAPDPKAFIPIVQVASSPYLLAVRPDSGISDLGQFVAYAKSHPGKLGCSTYGIGSAPHLALEMLKQAAGINVLHVPYRNFQQALPDLMSGQLQCAMDLPGNIIPQARNGSLVVIGATEPSKLESLRDMKLIADKYPEVMVIGWSGLFAPAGTPPEIVKRLEEAVHQALQDHGVEKNLENNYMGVSTAVTRDEFIKTVQSDSVRFGEVIRRVGIKAD